MGKFTGKTALVTGAGSGIGRAVALKLAEEGAKVIAVSRTKSNLDLLAQQNNFIQPLCLDLRNIEETEKAIKSVLPIQLLVNNAGVALLCPAVDTLLEDFENLFSLNVKAVMFVSQIVAKDLISRGERGNIVNVSSIAGQTPMQDHIAYCTSKASVDMMTKVFALELGPKHIRVNSVSPTVVFTEMGKVAWPDGPKTQSMLAKHPSGRFAEEADVVNSIVFLLSDESEMINGHSLPVDGGFLSCN